MLYQSSYLLSSLVDLSVHPHPHCALSLSIHLSLLFDFSFTPPQMMVAVCEEKEVYESFNKGKAAKMGVIWNTINVILYVSQAE